mmetsp:Transcript_11313/g.10953  ORF Transcript_11313/g.10953 Transcript_11313/m.10953 type:complete len:94 (+) Transcript_11313:107-388(+)
MSDAPKESKGSSSMPSFTIPSEMRLSKKWDNALERVAFSTAIGTAVCGLASLVLFKSKFLRFGFTSLGTGFGMGEAFRHSSYEFEKEKQLGKK